MKKALFIALLTSLSVSVGIVSGVYGTYFYADAKAQEAAMSYDNVANLAIMVEKDTKEKVRDWKLERTSKTLWMVLETETMTFRLAKTSPFFYQWYEVNE